jgi:hypothetical protein
MKQLRLKVKVEAVVEEDLGKEGQGHAPLGTVYQTEKIFSENRVFGDTEGSMVSEMLAMAVDAIRIKPAIVIPFREKFADFTAADVGDPEPETKAPIEDLEDEKATEEIPPPRLGAGRKKTSRKKGGRKKKSEK